MITISLCMIVKDEEAVIARCLNSVKDVVDEIVIADTGSTDGTQAICARYTNKIYDFPWIDDFSAARNFSFSKATMEYILWLDADDVLYETDRVKLMHLKRTLPPTSDVVMMKYNVGFDAAGNVTMSYFRERLVRRQLGCQWHEPVHEYLECRGKVVYSDVSITHKKEQAAAPGRNVRIYEQRINSGEELTPRGQYYFARELYYTGRYQEAIGYFQRFLDGGQGWIEDNIGACNMLAQSYAALGNMKGSVEAALRSFQYDTPRAENCCQVAYCFFANGEYDKAIYWYKQAMAVPKPEQGLGFIQHDYYGYIPSLQLCVCYDRLGRRGEAIRHNEMAARFKPGDAAVEHNRKYFSSLPR